jgi:uncharacterized protein YcfJ
MVKRFWMIGGIAGSAIGGYIGREFGGIMTSFVLSSIGMALGVYIGFKIARQYMD